MTTPNSEQDRLLEHNYDGIQEFDNPLPRWWVWIFWVSIVFAVVYSLDPFHLLRGPGRVAEYQAAMAEAARLHPVASDADVGAALVKMQNDPQSVAAGKLVFTTNCVPCHRADGGGIIGPNLTDDYWLHGGTLPEIERTISNGVLDKGMPNWGKMLKPDQVNAVAVYVYSLHGTNPPTPKPPQGALVERSR